MTRKEELQPGLNIYHFERDIEGNLIPLNIGRMRLSSGFVVRMFLTSTGLKFAIPEKSKDNGDIFWIDDDEHPGLGLPVKK